MKAQDPEPCACPAGADGRDHPERVLHLAMQLLLSRLDEGQRRWYAAVEATRPGPGGVRRVADITGLDEHTLRRGQQEVAGSLADVPVRRQRRTGGGRPPVEKGSRPS